MPTVRVRKKERGKGQRHPHVQVVSTAGSVMLGATEEKVDYDGLGSDWQMVPRPGTTALARRAGRNRLQAKVKTMLIDGYGGKTVEEQLLTLDRIAASPALCAVSYAEMSSHRWHLTRVELSVVDRAPLTNKILHADAALTFLVAIDEQLTVAPSRRNQGGKDDDDKKGRRTVVVRQGDTLAKIAARVYGNANRWPEIAKLNKIRNPRGVKPGRRLKV